MKLFQMLFFLLMFDCIPWATEAETSGNAINKINFIGAVNNSCMSMALHQFYSNSTHKTHTNFSSCDSQTSVEGSAASSGVFWMRGTGKDRLIEKKLKIGVPMKNGFYEFMKVDINPSDNNHTITGFPVDVFNEVMATLPYEVQYEFVPYIGDVDSRAHYDAPGYYNSLVSQVYFKEYDAVVGDIAITANRSDFVDFTYEFMESGVSMIVPVEDDDTSSPWWFMKPLTTELWLTTFAFAGLKGILVWFFERGDNQEFQGPPSEVVGKVLSFSFATFVFANNEKLKSNYSRFVVYIWTFLVFVLVTSYAANLTSMLTVERLQPTVDNLNLLIKKGEYIGYQKGSFVFDLLKTLGAKEEKLKSYGTIDEYAEALSNGSGKSGVSAIVDEIPFIRVFLKHHCHKYTKSDWNYRTGGFGFVFPRGSALVPDISRAILSLSEGEKMRDVERKWFGDQTKCPDSDTPLTNKRLRLYSLRSIYIIAGITSAVALTIYLIRYLYKTKIGSVVDRLMERGLWRWILALVQYFQRTGPAHDTRIIPQPEEMGEFNTIDEARPGTCSILMTENSADEGPSSKEEQEGDVSGPLEMSRTLTRGLSRSRSRRNNDCKFVTIDSPSN